MSDKFYVTTPIYYVNDEPHIGHSYTTIAADVLARYNRLRGRDVHFLTGTDEHGIKIVKAARQKGTTPAELADSVVVRFKELWKRLNISNDDFIRTSQQRHEKRVQEIIRRLLQSGEIYRGKYEGWYDEGQEEFVTDFTAAQNDYKSAINGKPLVRYSEESWFFRLSKWIDRLIGYIESHRRFILPESRRNEILSKLRQGVGDLSISRQIAKLDGWGIPMPNDPEHSVYVWIDALSNYITALGIPQVGDEFDGKASRYWPADIHLIGKDILWFHAVYWPALLMALGLPLPETIFAHGWWTSEGKKMSKSLGNFVSLDMIEQICQDYCPDAFRYFLLREVPFGADGDFSRNAFQTRYNNELANDIGNLLSRTVNMISRYFDGRVPSPQRKDLAGIEAQYLAEPLGKLQGLSDEMIADCRFSDYLSAVLDLTTATNRYIDKTEPFRLAREPGQKDRLATILYTCAEAVRIALCYLAPVMPTKAREGLAKLGISQGKVEFPGRVGEFGRICPGIRVCAPASLFPRKP